MRVLCLIASIVVLAHGSSVRAEDPRFPYEAIVDTDEGANVWSGPDAKKHYPTNKLNKGDRVKVIRHDPGGWCMIEPPAGSFSWVRASYIEKSGPDRGTLKENRVKVHVGSELNPDDFLTYQAELSRGDSVIILGEQTFNFDDTPRLMLKIKPVKREWRWIKRKSIIHANSLQSEPFPSDPLTPKRRGPVADEEMETIARPVSTGSASQDERPELSAEGKPENQADGEQSVQDARQKLSAIDLRFREMVQQDPPTWNLDSLEEDYEQLDADIGQPWMATEIGRRLDAVKRYRKTHKDYVEFFKITSEAKQRDAQLALQQAQFQGQAPTQRLASTNADLQPTPQPQPSVPAGQPQPQPPSPSAPQQDAAAPAFDGAGIVQKLASTFPGGPQYVLIAPDGRMLSFLQPGPGVNLGRYNGRSMGIIGQRSRREEWNADVITVRSLQPVQLRNDR